ncbi:mitochondrial calcium uniporter regulator 1 isoform X5 [Aquarana catesbeiana]|uniref:mitochondrial calcium uniporter regulator 1 isoform X5 n=1 Tax=Aquarana catesbeiana TaxID=8400 RepID=UPI003CC9BA43
MKLLWRVLACRERAVSSYTGGARCTGLQRACPRDYRTSVSLPGDTQKRTVFSFVGKKFYFDTHAVVQVLEDKGFSTQQSEVVVSALVKIMNTNMDLIYQDMVSKVQQEITLQQVMSHIASVKKDMIILEKSEFSALRTQNEYADHDRKLLELRTEIVEMHVDQDKGLTQTKRKIDTEVAGLKTMLESHKLDTIKYLAGSVFTCLTIALGFYRLWM